MIEARLGVHSACVMVVVVEAVRECDCDEDEMEERRNAVVEVGFDEVGTERKRKRMGCERGFSAADLPVLLLLPFLSMGSGGSGGAISVGLEVLALDDKVVPASLLLLLRFLEVVIVVDLVD